MRLSWIALSTLCGVCFAQTPAPSAHLSNIKQLTFGGQNAEAYWSPDGKRLIFQATRKPAECDQMYIMNADGSDQHMVSNGKGRTTCGFFLPDNKHIIYASTHGADAACPKPPDRSKGYAWGVFPGYDIYLATDDGKILKNLTDSPGYDAEATVNYKTKRIVYTSMASGDLDLWTMNIDGSNKKQVTKDIGYDGGADFSPDGKKIAWRGNHPSTPETMARYKELLADNLVTPMKMELMIADSDGKNPRQITDYGCASFAPAFTNDGKKIVFASNKHNCDGRKFELFMINADGTGLEQITDFGGFTSFADISPDGKKLVFVSDYQAKERYEFNVFTADWK
jgi:TolB protein